MFSKEEFNKKTISQLRWALTISLGYIVFCSHPGKSPLALLNVLLPVYALTNLVLPFGREEWFHTQRFISLILLLDLSMTGLTIYLSGPEDAAFYVAFFLVLLISAITHKAYLVYSTFGIILLAYGVTSYLQSPDLPDQECHTINLRNFPALQESLNSEEVSAEEATRLPLDVACKYILKKIPLSFKEQKLGTLYLRANTPMRSLTRREEYFLQILGRITAIAILDVRKSLLYDEMIDKKPGPLEVLA
ncbi:MAG: hypothetical protein WAW37_02675 [Syntrophobacteraceae bacterium]